ncbi:hypothetical protein [Deinococcus hopiensis]|uniref:Uncharacterized protein n=1 Tax=Deinococcus hopiensis KR-140 TaxID=695939 RepID=A0A1W1V849_9DEIO|nr:hypothetical protein [Deinococcus hopiensis]SMB89174.1 hypothetical protein SAMN00790413_00293 [Deinococcus hopiensis KR-140]
MQERLTFRKWLLIMLPGLAGYLIAVGGIFTIWPYRNLLPNPLDQLLVIVSVIAGFLVRGVLERLPLIQEAQRTRGDSIWTRNWQQDFQIGWTLFLVILFGVVLLSLVFKAF